MMLGIVFSGADGAIPTEVDRLSVRKKEERQRLFQEQRQGQRL